MGTARWGHLVLLLLLCIVRLVRARGGIAAAAGPCCHFSYAPQHCYSAADITQLGVHTADTWFTNGDSGGANPTSWQGFLNQTVAETKARWLEYMTAGRGRNISGGFATTNAIVLDCESKAAGCVGCSCEMKWLGTWLARCASTTLPHTVNCDSATPPHTLTCATITLPHTLTCGSTSTTLPPHTVTCDSTALLIL